MYKSGFVAIIGSPNVGKSSLLNKILSKKVSIVSPKVQTTRNTIRGIYHEEDCQIVFLDTPGFHKPKNQLNKFMVEEINYALDDVDAILYLIDAQFGIRNQEQAIIEKLKKYKNTPIVVAINKIDLVSQEKVQQIVEQVQEIEYVKDIVALSVKEGFNYTRVITLVKEYLNEGPQYYEKGQISDYPERFLISEIIREKIFLKTSQEVPYSIAVKVEEMYTQRKVLFIEATIYVERDSQKGILIGKKGAMLKSVGERARIEIENYLERKIYLDLQVKLLKNWGKNIHALKEAGYESE